MTNVLAISAHPDDAELGCGGTLAAHTAAGDTVTLLVVTKGERGPGETSDRIVEQERACSVLGISELIWGDLPDCSVSLHELSLVHLIESALRRTAAKILYTHNINDSHQDHRAVALASTGAGRELGNILTYHSPSSLQFCPTFYVDISATIDKKIDALMCHSSQVVSSEMVNSDRVRSQATVRGHEARCAAAEAFDPIRAVWSI